MQGSPGLIRRIQLEPEKRLPPPKAFLQWLIMNPSQMTWPKGKTYKPETQRWREMLLKRGDMADLHGPDLKVIREQNQNRAEAAALFELQTFGPDGTGKRWWAFEGQTHVDCYIETERMRIYIEGKRLEPLSGATDWFPKRNQLMRNIECASQDSGLVPFVNLVMAESANIVVPDEEASWPHLSNRKRVDLLAHFLGVVTWREACKATGIDYKTLPDHVLA